MTRLNVCCALITLSSAHGPLLLAAKRHADNQTGCCTNSPAENWKPEKTPAMPS